MTKVEESKIVVGLDVGTHKVVAVIGEVLPDGVINVRGVGVSPSKGVEDGGIVNLDEAIAAISRAIEEAEYIVDELQVVCVTLAMSGAHITAFNEIGQVPLVNNVKQEDIDNAIHIARSVKLPDGLEILHIIPQEYRVDRLPATKNPLNLAGNRLTAQAHLIACHNYWLLNLKNAVERSKYKIDQIVFSGLASGYSVLTEDEKELGVCLIDIGCGTMDILVYTDGALRFSKVIPFAGSSVTNYIAEMFATSRPQAEMLKIQHGSAISPPSHSPDRKITVEGLAGRPPRTFTRTQLSEVTAKCYRDLFMVVANELNHLRQDLYQKGIKQELIAGIVLTGGGSQIEDIVECAKSVFNAEVRVGYPLNITGLTDYVNKPQYATVLGLLQYNHYNDVESSHNNTGGDIGNIFNILVDGAKKVFSWTKNKF